MAKTNSNSEQLPQEMRPNLPKLTDEQFAELSEDFDAGTSKASEDNLVPIIYVLQKLSPQTDERNPKYVDGARPGDIWLRNAPNPIIKGDEGMIFQPCYFSIDWIEWVPRERGGGFVARHGSLPNPRQCPVNDAKQEMDVQNPSRIKYTRPNGNEIIQTRNHIGYVLNSGEPLPFVIPMTSTGHSISRSWMTLINSKQYVGGRPVSPGRSAPSYAYLYRLRTRQRSNAMGTWYTWDITDEREVLPDWEQYKRGKMLNESFKTQQLVPEAPMLPHQDQDQDFEESRPL